MNPNNQAIHKSPIPQKYVFLAAFILSLLMVFQSNVMVDGELRINLNRVIVFTFNYFTWAFAIPIIYRLVRPIELQVDWKKGILKLFIIGLLLCLVQLLISNLLYYLTVVGLLNSPIKDPLGHFIGFFPSAYLTRIIDFIVIFLLLKGLDNYRKLNSQKIAVAELESELSKSKLDALKMQLNPHFLFNSLHAIHSLIGYEDEKARSMVLKISNLLRRILELSNHQTIALSDELSYLKDYLDIEQERFHDRMEVIYHIDDTVLDFMVPSLMLQPLAENALKHGISPSEKNGFIKITIAELAENKLEIQMINSVDVNDEKVVSMGIGLSNLEKRLEQLYQDNYQMETTLSESAFEIRIILPKQIHEH